MSARTGPSPPSLPHPSSLGANITRPIRRYGIARNERKEGIKKGWRRRNGEGRGGEGGGGRESIHLEGKGTKGEERERERLSLWPVAASVSGLAFCDPLSRPIYRENRSIASPFFPFFHESKMNRTSRVFPRVREFLECGFILLNRDLDTDTWWSAWSIYISYYLF